MSTLYGWCMDRIHESCIARAPSKQTPDCSCECHQHPQAYDATVKTDAEPVEENIEETFEEEVITETTSGLPSSAYLKTIRTIRGDSNSDVNVYLFESNNEVRIWNTDQVLIGYARDDAAVSGPKSWDATDADGNSITDKQPRLGAIRAVILHNTKGKP